MENQTDTLKMYRHHQHARVQKERDEMWISSEDLRTEGSSDEEAQSSRRSRRMKKNKKQKKSALSGASKSTTSFASTPSFSTESCLKDLGGSASEIEKSTVETNIDMNVRRFSILDNPFFTDIFPDSAAGTSGMSLGSTDSGVDALNLESRWRPKRGSLKYPILVEGQTAANYQHEIDGFFTEMMTKLKSLRCRPSTDITEKEIEREDPRLFKHLKHTPTVKEKLKYIERLDVEIKETIQVYKAERAERLQIQNEMCNEICNNNGFPERDTRLFLELCHFEANADSNTEEAKENKQQTEPATPDKKNRNTDDNFIRRNIELARRGTMAGFSLTDEEKRKLEDLLVDEQEDSYSLQDISQRKDSGLSLDEPDEDISEEENYVISNAYVVNEDDQRRIQDINSELEKFTLDETEKEKVERKDRQPDWKDSILLDQRLKTINAELEKLRKSYEKEKENTESGNSLEVISCDIPDMESSEADDGSQNCTEDSENAQETEDN